MERLIPEERGLAYLVAVVALIATLLSLTGIYAVMAYIVGERTREFGIRVALGATGARVSRQVLRQVGRWCVAGTVAGLGLFAVASRSLSSRVYGVSSLDPLTIVAATLLLSSAALVAAWLPAWRAARTDPVTVLRES
jgi:ABC-type antimicrobial peptide transport system permease subunit